MNQGLRTAAAVAEVTRLSLAPTAVSNIYLAAIWSRQVEQRPALAGWDFWPLMALMGVIGIGMYVFGSTMNDVLDARRDRLFSPDRPIPSRRMTMTHVTVVALVGLLVAVGCAILLGPNHALMALVCAGLIVFYNAAGKHLPAVGVLTLGLIRAALMLIADPTLGFFWPVWLNMTHVVFISALVHRLSRKRPYLAPQELWVLAGGWVFWTLAMVFWMSHRGSIAIGGLPMLWVGPIVAGVLALAAGTWLIQTSDDDQQAGRRVYDVGMIWLIIYDGSWLLTAGLWSVAWVFGVLLVLAAALLRGRAMVQALGGAGPQYLPDRRVGM